MAQLWQLQATELAGLVRSREISAREAVQAALDRLNDVNDTINAVVDHRPADALIAADVIDARLRDGEEVGALAGVPVTVKINVDQAGYATTEGVTLQRDLVAKGRAPTTDRGHLPPPSRRGPTVLGLPVLSVSTGLLGRTPVGVQVVSGRYREDLCLAAGEAIEARGTPPAPVDPLDD